ncbi:hypothetical protein [Glycomyces sp. NPDC048151]|uniref:hypothetical protein n=1 Tax=Glycomyces sp. NPDC048151 TaxID=3364002 RepID=UPI003721FA89
MELIRPVFRPAPERKSVPPGFSADPSPEEVEPESSSPPRRYRWEGAAEDRYDFGKLREEAWVGFLEGSQELHDAHFKRPEFLREQFALAFRRVVGFFLRVFSVVGRSADWGEASADAGPVSRRISGRPTPSPRPRMMSGNPGQGSRRTVPVSSFVLDWERHFDAAQGFREAVTP